MTIQKLRKLSTADLEALAYNDPNDPTAPAPQTICDAQAELDRRDLRALPLKTVTHKAERVNGIRI